MAHSKRAEILRRVLEFINFSDWEEHYGFMIFGKAAFDDGNEIPDEDRAESAWQRPLREAGNDITLNWGQLLAAKRITVSKLPKQDYVRSLVRAMKAVNPAVDEARATEVAEAVFNAGPDERFDANALDAYMASRAVAQLERAVQAVGRYDDMNVRPLDSNIQRYFDEAHACHIYELDVAAAVLCRALLESALVSKIDPRGRIKRELENNPTIRPRSYVLNLIQKAQNEYLDPERCRCAREIKAAGDSAIHTERFAEFQSRYAGRMGEIVDNTRKVLIDLYNTP